MNMTGGRAVRRRAVFSVVEFDIHEGMDLIL